MTFPKLNSFIAETISPLNMGEVIDMISTAHHPCIFIKNNYSSYAYANDNFVHLMGLKSFEQLSKLSDIELSNYKKDAKLYRQLDEQVLEEEKPLSVHATLIPKYNNPITKTVTGKLYPLHVNNSHANYILGVVKPEPNIFCLDSDTIFTLDTNIIHSLLVKRSYFIFLYKNVIRLSKMEIMTIIQLARGLAANEIAEVLKLKQTTVESYLTSAKNKFGVKKKSELLHLIMSKSLLRQIIV